MRKLETQPYWAEMVAHKDELSLRELSERFGATPGAIMNAFRRNGIKRVDAPPGPRKHRKSQPLPPEPGEPVASRLGAHAALLGKVPDIEVAKKAGLSLRTVSAYRVSKGIPGYAGKSPPAKATKAKKGKPAVAPARTPKKPGRKSKIDALASEVGKTTDRVIAQKAGVTINAVRNWRRLHKVPAFAGETSAAPAKSAAAPSSAAKATAAKATAPRPAMTSGYAWRVVLVNGTSGVVVAANIADAAARASKVGEAASIERLGALLA